MRIRIFVGAAIEAMTISHSRGRANAVHQRSKRSAKAAEHCRTPKRAVVASACFALCVLECGAVAPL